MKTKDKNQALVGRIARPKPDLPWCWPWRLSIIAKHDPGCEHRKRQGDSWYLHDHRDAMAARDEIAAQRAVIVAYRTTPDGALVLLEDSSGDLQEVMATNIALEPMADHEIEHRGAEIRIARARSQAGEA